LTLAACQRYLGVSQSRQQQRYGITQGLAATETGNDQKNENLFQKILNTV